MRIVYFIPAIIWFIASVILLTLPQNDLPHSSLFNIPNFDKLVHLIMFFLLTVLFSYPFSKLPVKTVAIASVFKVAFSVIVYGIIMEFVQKYFTSSRAFDMIDILFDSLGSFLGLVAIRQYMYKKIGPNENRGRNQN